MTDPYKDHWYYGLFYRDGQYDYPLCGLVTAGLMFGSILALAAIFG